MKIIIAEKPSVAKSIAAIVGANNKKEGKEYKNDPGVMKQLNVIRELFRRGDSIIVATDAGRDYQK